MQIGICNPGSVFEGLGESEQGPNLYLRITARNFEKTVFNPADFLHSNRES
jgi:hypothetical protein